MELKANQRSQLKLKDELMKNIKQNKWFYLIFLPGFIYLIIFNYVPMYGLLMSFKEFDIVRGIWGSEWNHFGHFRQMFQSEQFLQVFRNSILISIYRLIWTFPAPIILAIMLNELSSIRFKKYLQTSLYLPHFISWVVVAGIVFNFLSPSNGIVNYIVKYFGGKPEAFLQKQAYFRTIIVFTDIWKETGWGTIMYLAALTNINTELYEAARIDGASRMQIIRKITIPGITSTIVVLFLLRVGMLMKNGFEQIFLLYNPLVYDVADVFETYTYRVGLMEGRYDFATAVGFLQSAIGFILIISCNKISKKICGASLW